MCTAALIVASVVGGGTAIADYQGKKAQWRNAKAAVDRRNAIAKQEWNHDLNLTIQKNQRSGQVYEAELDAVAAARTALSKQLDINQAEAARASTAAQLERNSAFEKAMLEGQKNLVSKIQATGKLLASGAQSGQSLLLQAMDIERQLGFAEATATAALRNTDLAYGLKEWGIGMDKYAADVTASNQQPSAPLAPYAEWAPIKPIKESAPSKPGILGSIMKGVSAGIGAGESIGGTKTKTWYGTTRS